MGPQGATGLTGSTGAPGAAGSQGIAGADGNPLFYGDSTTPLFVSSGTVDLDDISGPAVLNFSELTITAGSTVQVSSGSTIRVAGPCTIEGTLSVGFGSGVGSHSQLPINGSYPSSVPADPGMTPRAASPADAFRQSEFPAATLAVGGTGGRGLVSTVNLRPSRILFPTDKFGGGGGSPFRSPTSSVSGRGGGALRLLCEGALTVTSSGLIGAEGSAGEACCGGGGGGLLVLASGTSISTSGGSNLSVEGGNGGAGDSSGGSSCAPGGGGAGGAIVLIAPAVSFNGSSKLNGGTSGLTFTLSSAADFVAGGGGGGGAIGNGGVGGSVQLPATVTSGGAGDIGQAFQIIADPRAVM
jgi:hypothetical protein